MATSTSVDLRFEMGVPRPLLRRLSIVTIGATSIACAGTASVPAGGADAGTDGGAGEGLLRVKVELPTGVHVSRLAYNLASGVTSLDGTVDDSQDDGGVSSFTVPFIPASTYRLTLTGTSDDGLFVCTFPAEGWPNTADVPIAAGRTTNADVTMTCVNVQGLGCGCGLLVNTSQSNCPVWNEIVATPVGLADGGPASGDAGDGGSTRLDFPLPGLPSPPVQLAAGQELVIVATAWAPDPGALAFTWTATGGTLSAGTGLGPTEAGIANQAVFRCPPGAGSTNVVTLTLSDGEPDASVCDPAFTTVTLAVACSGADAPCDAACDAGLPDARD